ncbi:hypothetical protein D3C78_1002360 [compost metagenome]
MHVHDVLAHFDRHDHFFQRGIACAFTNAVQGAFDLASTRLHRGDGVADRHTQVVVAVDGDNGLIDIRYAVIQGSDNATKLVRRGVAHGIRNVNGGGTGVDRSFYHATQVIDWRTACIFTGEFYVVGVITGAFHRADRHLQHFVERALQF